MAKVKKYSSEKASEFWSKRLKSTNPLSAVLTYNAPKALNDAYDRWERESLLSALSKSLKGKMALDIGCGTGRMALTLARLGAEVTALDLSDAMLSHLNRMATKEKLVNRINLVQSSSNELPFGKSKFDIVTCFGLLEHLPEDIRRGTVQEGFRVMKNRGRMYVVVNNNDCILLTKKYKMKGQNPEGYFVTLVGLAWLEKVCRANQMKAKLIAANPMYALNHYFISPDREKYFGNEQNFERFCQNTTCFDLSVTLENPGLNRLAGHFVVRITKKI